MSSPILLKYCPEGCPVRIEAVTGPRAEVHRLHELGLREGVRLEVFRCGNPCILRVDGQKLCLRCSPGVQIWVQPEVFPTPPPPKGGFRRAFPAWGKFRWRHRGR